MSSSAGQPRSRDSALLNLRRLPSGATCVMPTAAFSNVARNRASLSARACLISTCSVISSLINSAPPIRPCTLRQGLIDHRTHAARPSFRSTKFFLLTQFLARQHTGMNIPPVRRRIWGYLVNRTADYLVGGQDFGGEQPCQIGKVTTGDSPITHPTIENGNGGRHLFDERLGGMCSMQRAHALALPEVGGWRAPAMPSPPCSAESSRR